MGGERGLLGCGTVLHVLGRKANAVRFTVVHVWFIRVQGGSWVV